MLPRGASSGELRMKATGMFTSPGSVCAEADPPRTQMRGANHC